MKPLPAYGCFRMREGLVRFAGLLKHSGHECVDSYCTIRTIVNYHKEACGDKEHITTERAHTAYGMCPLGCTALIS